MTPFGIGRGETFKSLLLLAGLFWLVSALAAQGAGGDARLCAGIEPHIMTAAGKATVIDGSGLFFYNPDIGAASYGVVYPGGHFYSQVYYPPGSLTTGWSHIVRANGLLFFYRQDDGLWATARIDQAGHLSTLRSGNAGIYAQAGTYVVGPMHVVSTLNGILICHYGGRYGDWPTGGIVGQINSDGTFRVTYSASFAAWAKVTNTPNGLLFWKSSGANGIVAVGRIQPNGTFTQTYSSYLEGVWRETDVVGVGNDLIFFPYANSQGISQFPRLSGTHRVGAVNSAGQFTLRSEECSPELAGGYVSPTVIGSDLLLYAMADTAAPSDLAAYTRLAQSGWAMVGNISSGNIYINPACRGKLNIKQEYPEGSFAAGWDQIVYTVNGVFFYNANTGDALAGSFDASGNFTETQKLPRWLDGGYRQIINVTD